MNKKVKDNLGFIWFIIGVCSAVLSFSNVTYADNTTVPAQKGKVNKKYEIRIGVGANSMFLGPALSVPGTLTFVSSLDYGKCLKIQLKLFPISFVEDLFGISASGGAGFKVHGKEAATQGGWEVILPLLVEVGFLQTTRDTFSDYGNDKLKWVLIGLSSGADFTWWSVGSKLGFNISLLLNYFFRVKDIDSQYTEQGEDKKGFVSFPDIAIVLGMAY
jgi:hypothetical protein